MKLGIVQAGCSACQSSVDWNIDPYVRFSFRGVILRSSICEDYGATACDHSKFSPPDVFDNLIPSDFTDGQMEICLFDSDGGWTDSDEICCMNPVWSPLTRTTGEYDVDPTICKGPGTLWDFRFHLEGIQ